MLISAQNVVHYLLDQNLLTPEAAVDGGLVVVDASRRNLNLKIIRGDAESYFLKQLRANDPQSVAAQQLEAAVYWLAHNDTGLASLTPLLPRFHLFDPTRALLVIELLPSAESLFERYRRLGRIEEEVARALGRALGAYHGGAAMPAADSPYLSVFAKSPPWILSLPHLSSTWFAGLSGANAQLIQIVQHYPEFRASLGQLREEWQTSSLIHGDIKWDNCVIGGDDGGNGLRLHLVDWELADLGDACWDTGAVLQGFIADWISAMRLAPEAGAPHLAGLPEHAFEDVQPVLAAFWQAYVEARRADGAGADDLLRRSVRYGAARMIQTAYEYMQSAPQISPNAVCLLQASADILRQPDAAIEQLLRLRR